uniref:Uncharacterized protein n=1 Tax=Serratia phage Kevin TaxID=3161161 RepID=A0AAU8L0D9_9CAUD
MYFSNEPDDRIAMAHVYGMKLLGTRSDTVLPHNHIPVQDESFFGKTGYELGFDYGVTHPIIPSLLEAVLEHLGIFTSGVSLALEDKFIAGNTQVILFFQDFLAGFTEQRRLARKLSALVSQVQKLRHYADRYGIKPVPLSYFSTEMKSVYAQTSGSEDTPSGTIIALDTTVEGYLLVSFDDKTRIQIGGDEHIPTWLTLNTTRREYIESTMQFLSLFVQYAAECIEQYMWDEARRATRRTIAEEIMFGNSMDNAYCEPNPTLENLYLKK